MSYPRESFLHKLRELLVIRRECEPERNCPPCGNTGHVIQDGEDWECPFCEEQLERKIITSKVLPPIPSRSFDWCATFYGHEPGSPIGHGATEQEAIDNLLESEEP